MRVVANHLEDGAQCEWPALRVVTRIRPSAPPQWDVVPCIRTTSRYQVAVGCAVVVHATEKQLTQAAAETLGTQLRPTHGTRVRLIIAYRELVDSIVMEA